MDIRIVNYDDYLSLCEKNKIKNSRIFLEDEMEEEIATQEEKLLKEMEEGGNLRGCLYDGLYTISYKIICLGELCCRQFQVEIENLVSKEDSYCLKGYEKLVADLNENKMTLPPPAEFSIKEWANTYILSDMLDEDGMLCLDYTEIGCINSFALSGYKRICFMFEVNKEEDVVVLNYKKMLKVG